MCNVVITESHLTQVYIFDYHLNYQIQIANGNWNNWSPYSACSKTCGGGSRSKTRTKKVKEVHGGNCEGEHKINESCNTQDCPGSMLGFNV